MMRALFVSLIVGLSGCSSCDEPTAPAPEEPAARSEEDPAPESLLRRHPRRPRGPRSRRRRPARPRRGARSWPRAAGSSERGITLARSSATSGRSPSRRAMRRCSASWAGRSFTQAASTRRSRRPATPTSARRATRGGARSSTTSAASQRRSGRSASRPSCTGAYSPCATTTSSGRNRRARHRTDYGPIDIRGVEWRHF